VLGATLQLAGSAEPVPGGVPAPAEVPALAAAPRPPLPAPPTEPGEPAAAAPPSAATGHDPAEPAPAGPALNPPVLFAAALATPDIPAAPLLGAAEEPLARLPAVSSAGRPPRSAPLDGDSGGAGSAPTVVPVTPSVPPCPLQPATVSKTIMARRLASASRMLDAWPYPGASGHVCPRACPQCRQPALCVRRPFASTRGMAVPTRPDSTLKRMAAYYCRSPQMPRLHPHCAALLLWAAAALIACRRAHPRRTINWAPMSPSAARISSSPRTAMHAAPLAAARSTYSIDKRDTAGRGEVQRFPGVKCLTQFRRAARKSRCKSRKHRSAHEASERRSNRLCCRQRPGPPTTPTTPTCR